MELSMKAFIVQKKIPSIVKAFTKMKQKNCVYLYFNFQLTLNCMEALSIAHNVNKTLHIENSWYFTMYSAMPWHTICVWVVWNKKIVWVTWVYTYFIVYLVLASSSNRTIICIFIYGERNSESCTKVVFVVRSVYV